MSRTNFAPKFGTIIVALLLALVGALGTLGHLIPTIAGVPGETIGIAFDIVATAILLAGCFFRGI